MSEDPERVSAPEPAENTQSEKAEVPSADVDLERRFNELQSTLLEEKSKSLKMEEQIAQLNRERAELLATTSKQLSISKKEAEALQEEIDQMSSALFEEANHQVESANKDRYEVEQLNKKMMETLKEKDSIIDLLQSELTHLKTIITKSKPEDGDQSNISNGAENIVQKESNDCVDYLRNTFFDIPSLDQYNNTEIAKCQFNQLRLDSQFAQTFKESLTTTTPDTWSIRSTKIFELILQEIENCVRLDKAPVLKFKFNKRSILTNLLDYKAGIEPLSASTESWKRAQLTQTDHKHKGPLAIHEACSLCGEKRPNINNSRIYKMIIFKKEKEIYNLCISCTGKWRLVIPLMNLINNIKPISNYQPVQLNENEKYIPSLVDVYDQYFQLMPYLIKLTYLRFGIWENDDHCGLVYGWHNSWLGKFIEQKPVGPSPASPLSRRSSEQTVQHAQGETSGDNLSDKSKEPTGQSDSPKNSSLDIPKNRKSAAPGVNLRVVSGASSKNRLSVNMNLLLNKNASESDLFDQKKDSANQTDDNEDESEFVDAEQGQNEEANQEETDENDIQDEIIDFNQDLQQEGK